jgi:outer membrane protein OmpA-like peptidoglycan-associated protein
VIYFLPEDAALIPATAARLKDLAAALEALPGEGGVLELTGHCALYGTEESRVELSRRRAENAAAFLKNQGLNWTFRISAEGGRRPVTLDPDRQELNRRVEIRRRP